MEEVDSYLELQPSSSSTTASTPSSSASSSPLDPSDPDFIGPKRHKPKSDEIVLTLTKKNWIEALTPHADRGRLSNADIFRFCTATIQAGGGNLSEFPISEESIRQMRIAAQKDSAKKIKVREIQINQIILINMR